MELASPSTALSPAVKQLICCVGCNIDVLEDEDQGEQRVENETRDIDSIYVTSSAELELDRVASLLPLSVPASENMAEYYKKAVGSLASVFVQCQHAVLTLSDVQIQLNLLPRLQWTFSEKIFYDCLEMMREHPADGSKNILVLLLISAVLERSLGNVYLLQGTQCPSLLKDLLVTDELANTLGDSVVQMLRIVIGPPTSLNLRNVAWHGFLGDQELSCRYCCFLVLLAASMGDTLSRKGIGPVPQRSFFTWTSAVKSKMLSPSQSSGLAEDINLQSLKNLLTDSLLIQPQTVRQWQLVFFLNVQGRYGYCLALLLPLLEHCLRRVFATVNTCPERVLTAESSAFYTTFNEMLEQNLSDGAMNRLPEFLTTPCMDLLHDLLFYPEGPRVRDHLSHGEMDFASVGEDVVYPFLCVVVFLAQQLRAESAPSLSTYCKEMVEKVKVYRSVFHPVAILQQKFAGLLCQLEKTESCILVSSKLESLAESAGVSKLCEDNLLLTRTQGEILSLWACEQWSKDCSVSRDDLVNGFSMQLDPLHKLSQEHIPTLFRWQFDGDSGRPGAMKESELVGLLLRISDECTTAIEQMQQSLQQRQTQLFAKELRSRQRENLKKLLVCVPCLQMLVAWIAVMVCWNMQQLHNFSSISACKCRMMQKYLKQVLQHCENLRTFTSSDRNKWTESVELLIGLIPKCQNFFVQWYQEPDVVTSPPKT